MNPLLKEFISEISSLTGCAAIGIRILDEEGNIPYQAFVGFSRRFYNSESPLSLKTDPCTCTKVILNATDQNLPYYTKGGSFCMDCTSRYVAAMSEEEKRQARNVCNKLGYESVALIPIRAGVNILGLIHLADPRKNMLPLEVIEILEATALQLGTAIERVKAKEALQNSHRELERQVKNRTAELVSANERLNLEIEEHKWTEKKLLTHQAKLRSLSSELLLAEERERRRIATELHDRIGQSLAISKIKLGALRKSLASSGFIGELDEIREFIEQTIQDTRSLTYELSPAALYELSLEAALEGLVEHVQEQHGLSIKFRDDSQPKTLNHSCRIIVFQVIRELLFNIVKHARAREAAVSIGRDGDALNINIADNGVGFDLSEVDSRVDRTRGFGLFSIRERLSYLGGCLEIQSEPGSGTRIAVRLPLSCGETTKERSV